MTPQIRAEMDEAFRALEYSAHNDRPLTDVEAFWYEHDSRMDTLKRYTHVELRAELRRREREGITS